MRGKVKKEESKKSIRLLVPFLLKHWLLLGLCLILSVGTAVTVILESYLLKVIMDGAIDKDMTLVIRYTMYIVATTMLILLMGYFKTYFSGRFSEKITYELRMKTFRCAKDLNMEYYDTHNSGDIVSRITSDIGTIKGFLQDTIISALYEPLIFILAIMFMFKLSVKLTIFSVLAVPVMILISILAGKPIGKYSKEQMDELGAVNSFAQDIIGGISVIKAYTLESIMGKKYNAAVDKSIKKSLKVVIFTSLNIALGITMSMIPFIIVFGYGGYLAINGEMTYGGVFAFINVMNFVARPLSTFPVIINSIKTTSAGLERVNEIWSEEKERIDGENYKTDNKIAINFKNVTFGYKTGEKILNNISFQVKDGETVALVGHSGCGKSTVLKLLTGFYKIQEGDIEIYGHSLNDWNLNQVRKNLSLVSQDNYLFPESIYTNISYGRENATGEEIKNAIEIANIDELIGELEAGMDTLVGERGSRISGGQKQRISIARALVKNAKILLLDEATSALDINSEYEVQKGLDELLKGRTAVIVSHRLSTIKNVDRIIVIDEGRVVEEGKEETLLENGKLYKELYSTQLLKEA